MSLQSFDSVILSQDLHLAYSDGIEFCQPFGLRHPLIDEHRIQVLQIGQADQLRDIGVVTDIPFQIGMAVPAESSGGIRFSLIASVWMR